VKAQLLIAAGERLPYCRAMCRSGHAIECRINAEDARHSCRSRTDPTLARTGGPGVRVDSHIYSGYNVPPNYDSLVGKIIAYGESR